MQVKGHGVRKARSSGHPEAIKNLGAVEERMPLGFLVFGKKELEAALGSDSARGSPAPPPPPNIEAGADSPELPC